MKKFLMVSAVAAAMASAAFAQGQPGAAGGMAGAWGPATAGALAGRG